MSTTVILPPAIALKSLHFNKYLNYSDDPYSSTQGFVKFNGTDVFSPLANFEVVMANNGTSGVHIRCRKNRKFLQRTDESSVFISPEGVEPEENQSNWWCTLFEPQLVQAGNNKKVYLLHVQSQSYANAWDDSGITTLRLTSNRPHVQGVYHIIDQASLLRLPKYVAFKGTNGCYLRTDGSWLQHASFWTNDKGIAEARYQTSSDGDGNVHLKSIHQNSYMKPHNDASISHWVYFDSPQPHANGKFWPVKIDSNTVALRSLFNNRFLQRYNGNDINNCLRAHDTSLVADAHLTIEEHVRSREIYNTVYDLGNAKIYAESPMVMGTTTATNSTAIEESNVSLNVRYMESKSTTWTTSHSWMVGVSVTVSLGIPLVVEADVTVSTEYSGSYEWGETKTTETELQATYTTAVPPYSTVTVNLIATKGTCDVHYSYHQRDQLYDGGYEIYQKDDGVCRGVNSFNFHFEVITTKNQEPGANFSESRAKSLQRSLDDLTTVQKIPLPHLSGVTTVQSPVMASWQRVPPRCN